MEGPILKLESSPKLKSLEAQRQHDPERGVTLKMSVKIMRNGGFPVLKSQP